MVTVKSYHVTESVTAVKLKCANVSWSFLSNTRIEPLMAFVLSANPSIHVLEFIAGSKLVSLKLILVTDA